MHDSRDTDDELLERLFRALGPQPALPDEMKRNWAETFGRELANRNAARRRRRGWIVATATAAAVLVAVAVGSLLRAPTPTAAVATVVMASGPIEATVSGSASVRLVTGGAVASGARISTGPDARLALRYRATDLRVDANTVVVAQSTRLQLRRGAVYVDSGPRPTRGPSLTIETPFGTLGHIGTQFMVIVTDHDMRAAVREGSIAMDAAGERRTISAVDGARQATVTADGITVSSIAATAGPWAWVAAAAPAYPIDGASADAFLRWAARQLGSELRYADTATATHARLVTLHGDVNATVAQGLAIVDGTTDLAVDHSDPAVLAVHARR